MSFICRRKPFLLFKESMGAEICYYMMKNSRICWNFLEGIIAFKQNY